MQKEFHIISTYNIAINGKILSFVINSLASFINFLTVTGWWNGIYYQTVRIQCSLLLLLLTLKVTSIEGLTATCANTEVFQILAVAAALTSSVPSYILI